jgi:hypothetical protein
MPKLVINPGHKFTIHGRDMKAGDEFECTDREAVLWRVKGWASDAPPPKVQARGRYSRADMRVSDSDE